MTGEGGIQFGLRRWRLTFAVLSLATLLTTPVLAESEPATTGAPPVLRRLTPSEYQRTIEDIFGPGLHPGGRFEPELRTSGLLAVGASQVSVTASGFEQYFGMARAVAAQVMDEAHRPTMLPCAPASATDADDVCAGRFLGNAGRLIFRRPLTGQELQLEVSVANQSAKSLKDFHKGLEAALADLLVSPKFLFSQENAEPDPDHSGQYRLDAFAKAARISFLLWDASPDSELLRAAESGELNTKDGLSRQVDRLLSSPRLEAGVRAFFSDMLGFDGFSTLSKDATIYPSFTSQAIEDASEQTLRTIVDTVLTRHQDYRDIFTTRRTFLTSTLGIIYSVPVVDDRSIGDPENWIPYEYPEGDPRTGILTQASFVALHSHPGRSSPTLRGKALREIVLCQKVPDPPGNVNFTVVQDTKNPVYKTARERVTAHRTDAVCAGCHKLIDPMGLAMENFDSAGGYRLLENGTKIDASGELDGTIFTNAAGLGKAVHDHPAAPACLVSRLYSYASGHAPAKGEAEWVKYLEKGFAADGYRMPELLGRIATSDALYRVSPPQTGDAGALPRAVTQDASQAGNEK